MSFDANQDAFVDDMDVTADYSEGGAPPQPVDSGTYRVRIKKFSYETVSKDNPARKLDPNRDGVPTYPIIKLEQVEIVESDAEGTDVGKLVFLYQKLKTKPFTRKDPKTKMDRPANNIADLLRSNDQSATFNGLEDGLAQFEAMVASGGLITVRLDWKAQDMTYAMDIMDQVKAEVKAAGGDENNLPKAAQDTISKAWKDATRKGQHNFKQADGSFATTFDGPSGETLPVRVEIAYDGIVPVSRLGTVKLGSRIKREEPVAA